jgi:MFS family permease
VFLARFILIWTALACAIFLPIAAAAVSPQLEWRRPVYIAAGFAGIIGLGFLLLQPLLIGGYLPGVSASGRRRAHRWIGGLLVAAVVFHVGALWITSAPDVIDALFFTSPTPFAVWGVIAMWATFAAALLAALRGRLRVRPRTWKRVHAVCVAIIAVGTVVHAVLIEGTMETISKTVLCALVTAASLKVVADPRLWSRHRHRAED